MGRITNAIEMGMAIYSEIQKRKLPPPRLVPNPALAPVRTAEAPMRAASLASEVNQQRIENLKLAAFRAGKKQPPAQLKMKVQVPQRGFSR